MSDLLNRIGELDELLRTQISGPARSRLISVLKDIEHEIKQIKGRADVLAARPNPDSRNPF